MFLNNKMDTDALTLSGKVPATCEMWRYTRKVKVCLRLKYSIEVPVMRPSAQQPTSSTGFSMMLKKMVSLNA